MNIDFSQVDPAFQHVFDAALAGCDYPFPDTMKVQYKTREGTGGRAYGTGLVEIGTGMVDWQIRRAVLHETFHQVAFQTYTDFHKRVFANLLHSMDRCTHPWTEENFTNWAGQVDEAVCELHIRAFSQERHNPMKHTITKGKARKLRALYLPTKAAWLA